MKQSLLKHAAIVPPKVRHLDTASAGLLFGIIATAGYTLAGIILRDLADDTDPYWVSCIKAVPTLVVAMWLIHQRKKRGQAIKVPLRLIPALLAIGVIVQIGGNAGSQWAFEIIGLAITIPMMFGTLIVGSAVIGVLMFQERLTTRRLVAVVMLIAAVSILSLAAGGEATSSENVAANAQGAREASTSATTVPAVLKLTAMGVLVACLSGIAYAISHAAIRQITSPEIPLSVPLAVFSIAGIVALGAISGWRIGWDGIVNTTANQWWRLWAAGVVNAVAYFALGRTIQLLPLVQVNIITASQVALNAVAGIVIFSEPISAALIIGVSLTMMGLLIQGRWKRTPAEASKIPSNGTQEA
ncbi:MAG: DMT family transporter [Pirellulales bacterium]|nr:DMT family transporter [Pirellulales bacterium]